MPAPPPADDRTRGSAASLVSMVLLAAWLGASLLTAVVVAPAAFAVLPTRALAGALVGRVLPVLFLSGAVLGVIVALLDRRSRRGREASPFVTWAGLVILAGCLTAQLGIAPRIDRLRVEAGVPMDALAPTDARRVAFGRLHGASVVALGVSMLAAAAALVGGGRVLLAREGLRRPATDG